MAEERIAFIAQHNDHYQVDLSGFNVTRCIIDYAVTLDLRRDPISAEIRISTPFEYKTEGVDVRIDPEGPPEELASILGLCRGRSVMAVTVWKNGTLEVSFDDESRLSVPADEQYEAWTLSGPSGALIVSGPGGAVSIFGSADSSTPDQGSAKA